jgi:ubiquinone/menaquinone biosynthesis C-methylase UbiE
MNGAASMVQRYKAKSTYSGKVAQGYDDKRFKSAFGRWIDAKEKLSVTRAMKGVPKGASVLDMPCGNGRITEHLLGLDYVVTGADISQDMINLAPPRIASHPRFAGYKLVDAEDTKLPAESYDCITSIRFMGHLPRDVKVRVLKEMARVSRKHLVVAFYLTSFARSVKWFLKYGQPQSRNTTWYPITASDLDRLLEECGLEVVKREPAFVVSDSITFLLRKK